MPCIYMPAIFYQSGALVTALLWVVYGVISIYVNLLIIQGMKLIKGNEDYRLSIEYVGLFKELFGRKAFIAFECVYLACLLCCNIYMIRTTSQTVDDVIRWIVGCPDCTFGVALYPAFSAGRLDMSQVYNRGSMYISITLGYVIVSLVQILMGMLQFGAFTVIQSFGVLLVAPVSVVALVYEFGRVGINKAVPLVGRDFSSTVSMIAFSLAIGGFMPAWVNQKRSYVDEKRVVFGVSLVSMVLNIVFPLLAVYAYGESLASNISLFDHVLKTTDSVFVRCMIYLFEVTLVASLTPINSITLKNNLFTESGLGRKLSIFFGVFFQYLISWAFLKENILMTLIQYVTLLLVSFVGFFFPIMIYYRSQSMYSKDGNVPESMSTVWPGWVVRQYRVVTTAVSVFLGASILGQLLYDLYVMVVLKRL
ncbi:uncharacterized protein LOC126319927 [Schistocerca gregaria]|uniref:uncharacterized protein LOC126319927 n=1 Tax=Schistocerca gregaria TaxID=7010 RepID=UPI00211E8C8E|nr:uncharacterized protein LOC126319927 [Schistocerca gregaria]